VSVAPSPQCRIWRMITEEWIRNAVKGSCGDAIWGNVLVFILRGWLRRGSLSLRARCRGQDSNPSMKEERSRLDGDVQHKFYSSEPLKCNVYVIRYSRNVFQCYRASGGGGTGGRTRTCWLAGSSRLDGSW